MKKVVILSLCSLLLVAAVGGYFGYRRLTTPGIPKVLSAATFPVYYPKTLPSGWVVKRDSHKVGQNHASFTIFNEATKTDVLITEEVASQNFNNNIEKILSKVESFTTPEGLGKVGEISSTPEGVPETIKGASPTTKFGFLQTNNGTLIQISSASISKTDMEMILRSFKGQK